MVQTTVNTDSASWGFRSISLWLAFVIAAGIIYIGFNGLFNPAAAAAGFGIPIHHADDLAFVRIKAVRDIVSGLVPLAFMLLRKPRALGMYILIATLIPIGDCLLVLLTGDHQPLHLAIHGGTAIYMLIVGSVLYRQGSSKEQ